MTQQERFEVSRRVAIVGALTNTLLAIVKLLFGLLGHSQSLLADGVHSLSDLLTDGLVLFTARHAKEAPDEEHPYGHGRFETIGTLVLGGFLLAVGVGIVWDAVDRLFSPEQLLQPEAFTLYVAAFSILANEGLFFYTRHFANKINSNLLRANAWHHRTDSVSSIVVLIGIGGTILGLPYLDAIAAVLVGIMILKIGWDLGWTASQELVDAGLEEESLSKIREVIGDIGGVKSVHMLRTRKLGGHALADVHVQVDPWLSVSEGHRIAEVVQYGLIDRVDVLEDVTVHIDPEDDEAGPSCAHLPLRSEAEVLFARICNGLSCYEEKERMVLHYLSGQIDIELYLPLHCFVSNQQAEQLRSDYRAAVKDSEIFRDVQIWFG
ncbi:MAG: cation diffusion facilitator family transporter [Candidatus Thiodiazotropha sp.]|jgi:cation diffusion facilitator family transporter